MSDLIRNMRLYISSHGNSELEMVAKDEYLQDLFKKKQDLINEMNANKRRAADEAAAPYLEAIEELDKAYAMMLSLSGNG
jgi:hypothetical protein